MPLVLRSVKGSPLTIAEGDGNFTYLDGRIDTVAALVGKTIDSIEYSASAITFNLSDSSTVVVPLPVPEFTPRGEWLPSTPYFAGDLVNVRGIGLFLVLLAHTSDTTFDPDATDGTTDNNPLYQLWAPLRDVNYDIALSFAGLIEGGSDNPVIAQIVIPRAVEMAASLPGAYGMLGVPTSFEELVFSLEQNGVEIGTLTFTPGEGMLSTDGPQEGTFEFLSDVTFAGGDRFTIRGPMATDAFAADLSISIPTTRQDI